MATVYVVREGKVRGEGAYWDFGCFDHGTAKGDALRLTRVGAMLLASKYGGRIVRIVTLSEQLRRAKKRIAELEGAIGGTARSMRAVAVSLGVPSSYHQGRADERQDVINAINAVSGVTWEDPLVELLDTIGRGAHVKGGGS